MIQHLFEKELAKARREHPETPGIFETIGYIHSKLHNLTRNCGGGQMRQPDFDTTVRAPSCVMAMQIAVIALRFAETLGMTEEEYQIITNDSARTKQ